MMEPESTETAQRLRPAWGGRAAVLWIVGFVGACVAIAVIVASAMREAGHGWFPSLLIGASAGVMITYCAILLALRLASGVKSLIRWRRRAP